MSKLLSSVFGFLKPRPKPQTPVREVIPAFFEAPFGVTDGPGIVVPVKPRDAAAIRRFEAATILLLEACEKGLESPETMLKYIGWASRHSTRIAKAKSLMTYGLQAGRMVGNKSSILSNFKEMLEIVDILEGTS